MRQTRLPEEFLKHLLNAAGGVFYVYQFIESCDLVPQRTRKNAWAFTRVHSGELVGTIERATWSFRNGESQGQNAAGGSACYQIEEVCNRPSGAALDFGQQYSRNDASNAAAVDG